MRDYSLIYQSHLISFVPAEYARLGLVDKSAVSRVFSL